MITFVDVPKENIKEHNPSWSQIPDYPYRILIFGDPRPGKANSLFNLINQQPGIDKISISMLKISIKQNITFKFANNKLPGQHN